MPVSNSMMMTRTEKAGNDRINQKMQRQCVKIIDTEKKLGLKSLGFQVHFASSSARNFPVKNLESYGRKTWWESYQSRSSETIIIALNSKALVSELKVLNKNVSELQVSVAIEDRPRSYIKVKHLRDLAHSREIHVKTGFFPCSYIKLEVFRHQHDSVGIYGLSPVGIPSFEVEDDAGPSMCNLLSYMTESILFGPSLRLSQPYMDCLSDYISGDPEWMEEQKKRTPLLDERIARLEKELFT